jgi:hypothetical protein
MFSKARTGKTDTIVILRPMGRLRGPAVRPGCAARWLLGAARPLGLFQHLLVLVLAHLLAPLLDD